MNQDQIKNLLLRLNPDVPDFSVVMTGKKSLKVHGLYKPDTREILLHNKNFDTENELVYTAIHEFAHHVHFTSAHRPLGPRSHNTHFWDLFHRLMKRAEELQIYRNVFVTEPDFLDLTGKIKKQFMEENGQMMKDFGQLLVQASELCRKHHARFEDYMDRVLCIPRTTAKTLMQSFSQDIDPRVGFDNMKSLVAVRDPQRREELTAKIREGYSPEMLKKEIRSPQVGPEAPPSVVGTSLGKLMKDRDFLKKKIDALQQELSRLEQEIHDQQEGSHEP